MWPTRGKVTVYFRISEWSRWTGKSPWTYLMPVYMYIASPGGSGRLYVALLLLCHEPNLMYILWFWNYCLKNQRPVQGSLASCPLTAKGNVFVRSNSARNWQIPSLFECMQSLKIEHYVKWLVFLNGTRFRKTPPSIWTLWAWLLCSRDSLKKSPLPKIPRWKIWGIVPTKEVWRYMRSDRNKHIFHLHTLPSPLDFSILYFMTRSHSTCL